MSAQAQLDLASPVMITLDFRVDLMWTQAQLVLHLLNTCAVVLVDVRKMIEAQQGRPA